MGSWMFVVLCLMVAMVDVNCFPGFEDFIDSALFQDTKNHLVDLGNGLYCNDTCYKDIGCFYNGPPYFDPPKRGFSFLRHPREVPNVRFSLYTPETNNKYDLQNTQESIECSGFDSSRPTVFLILGFQSGLFVEEQLRTKDKILRFHNVNVIIPEFAEYMETLDLPQAANDCRTIGARLGLHILFLASMGARIETFHLIGWSYGAHIAGYAGKFVKQRSKNHLVIGRITAEDAAGPFFNDCADEVRLAQGDAQLVVAIHTNGESTIIEGWGYLHSYADVDIFVNGGSEQPDCDEATILLESGDKLNHFPGVSFPIFCNHNRSREYFDESIDTSECKFLAYSCPNYDDFENGKCTGKNSIVFEMGFYFTSPEGYDIEKLRGKSFYLTTNGSPPYCKKQSQETGRKCRK